METILLPVKAKHFKDARYLSCAYCPIANAVKDFFNLEGQDYVNEGVNVLYVKEDTYWHKVYDVYDYDNHAETAAIANYDETIIFTLKLTKA